MEPETLKKIEDISRRIFEALGISAAGLTVAWQEAQERIYVSLDAGAENGFLIGKEGRTLEAVKEIIEAAASRAVSDRVDIYLDIGNYWSKIEAKALETAQRAAEETKHSGRPVRLDPMHPMLRRFLHKTFQADPEIETFSEGEGIWKRMVIQQKRAQP
ncbi:MAG: KH domain-containing protein [Elusimicrobia bacterium]|nr:KH domain-containing protein [Elusimicrobiota bacterium]